MPTLHRARPSHRSGASLRERYRDGSASGIHTLHDAASCRIPRYTPTCSVEGCETSSSSPLRTALTPTSLSGFERLFSPPPSLSAGTDESSTPPSLSASTDDSESPPASPASASADCPSEATPTATPNPEVEYTVVSSAQQEPEQPHHHRHHRRRRHRRHRRSGGQDYMMLTASAAARRLDANNALGIFPPVEQHTPAPGGMLGGLPGSRPRTLSPQREGLFYNALEGRGLNLHCPPLRDENRVAESKRSYQGLTSALEELEIAGRE